jgi:hypothetical protein
MGRPSAAVAKKAPLTPASARLAAAAGVKPAALLTKVEPNERAVPKPAFELTEKKLDPKAGQPGTKKNAVAKRKRVAAKSAKEISSTKKAASSAKKSPQAVKNHSLPTAKPPAAAQKPNAGQKPSAAIAKGQGDSTAD